MFACSRSPARAAGQGVSICTVRFPPVAAHDVAPFNASAEVTHVHDTSAMHAAAPGVTILIYELDCREGILYASS